MLKKILTVCLLLHSAMLLAAPPRIGVVLGGGGARGFAHLGVLQELEKLHVPIACMAGTSAGALIGGAYASGQTLADLEQQFAAADWETLLSGKPRRQDVPYNRKQSDSRNYFDLTVGYRDGKWRLPKAAINAQGIDLFIRQLTRARNEASFDQLSIPFRAVATDLESGDPVIFDRGDLSLAMRASMAVPGMFAPVEAADHILVDGGMARQLPVEELKGRCADVLIVIDVGTPPVPRDQLGSFLDVLDQTTYLMVARNSRESLARLGPQDILIRPQLDGVSPADFADNAKIIEAGRLAARTVAPQLAALASSPEQYAAWQQNHGLAERPRIDRINVAGNFDFVDPQAMQQKLAIGSRLGLGALHQKLGEVFAEGDLDKLDYTLRQQDGQHVADVHLQERHTGPNYIRGGLELRSSSQGDATFSLLGEFKRSWLNRAGGSLLAEAKLGEEPTFRAEWLQPWMANSPAFLSLGASRREKRYNLYVQDHQSSAEFQRKTNTVNVDTGWSLGSLGEWRAGWYGSRDTLALQVGYNGLFDLSDSNAHEQGLRTRLVLDQLDNPRWPRNGYALQLDMHKPLQRSDDPDPQPSGAFMLDTVTTDRHDISWRLTLRGGYSDKNDAAEVFELGGFRNLSGYQPGELLGHQMAFVRGMVSWRVASLPSALGSGLYVGASAEAGQVWAALPLQRSTGWLPAGSLFVGADTLLGPVFMGVGYGKKGQLTGYFNLGVEY
jgi:NTE family protein